MIKNCQMDENKVKRIHIILFIILTIIFLFGAVLIFFCYVIEYPEFYYIWILFTLAFYGITVFKIFHQYKLNMDKIKIEVQMLLIYQPHCFLKNNIYKQK